MTDWEESHVSDAKVPKFRLARSARSQSFMCFSRVSVFLVGINHHSWTRPYHECYEHKDIIYCTDKPCDLSTEYWGESYVSDPKIPQISARSQYSFFISFWFSGRLKKPYTFLTQSRKSAKISARSLCSLITINVFFSSFWNVSGRYKSSWIRPYNECYEQKDTLYRQTMWFTNKILRRIACFRHTQKKMACSQSCIAFSQVSGFLVGIKKNICFWRKSAKISARSLCSLTTINGFFSSFWSV